MSIVYLAKISRQLQACVNICIVPWPFITYTGMYELRLRSQGFIYTFVQSLSTHDELWYFHSVRFE